MAWTTSARHKTIWLHNNHRMTAHFQDINFKLCAIQELMYNQHVLLPQFNIYAFAKDYKHRAINIDAEGHAIIPEALEYFRQLEIPAALLANIPEIYQDGGNAIYMQIAPLWDGEDEQFNISNAKDASLFPNLRKMTIFYDADQTVLEQLKAQHIDVAYL